MNSINSSNTLKVILLGLPSAAIIAYLYHAHSKSSEDYINDDINNLKSRQCVIEMRIPSNHASIIIGQGGVTIKELQRKTNTRINFKDKYYNSNDINSTESQSEPSSMPSSERLLIIRGSNLNVHLAEIEIKRLLIDIAKQTTEQFLVPNDACGRIIGKRGASIKELSMLSNCKIQISDEPILRKLSNDLTTSNNEPINKSNLYDIKQLVKKTANLEDIDDKDFADRFKLLTITGSLEQIEHAKELILAKIKEEEDYKTRRKRY